MDRRQRIEEYLKGRGFRITLSRAQLLEVLSGTPAPLRVEELNARLALKPSDLPTLYRNLSFLVEQGVVHTVHFQDGKTRYELSDRFRAHHHHFVCDRCGEVQDLPECLEPRWIRALERQYGFTVRHHSLEFYGLCGACHAAGDRPQPAP